MLSPRVQLFYNEVDADSHARVSHDFDVSLLFAVAVGARRGKPDVCGGVCWKLRVGVRRTEFRFHH